MIQHPRDVSYTLGMFDNPQQQIVILRPIESRTKTSNIRDQLSAQKNQVTQIITGKKEVRRPVRFEHWDAKTLLSHFIFVGVDQIKVGIFLKQPHVLEEGIGFKDVVVIKKSDPFAAGSRESMI